MTTINEVGDDHAGHRREPDDSNTVERNALTATLKSTRLVLADAANATLQERQ